jgi:predicted XRE-type DNA-binding protein
LDKVQNGEDADDWKPMPAVGSGVHEIRVRDESGAFRLMYVAKFPEAVYVLHAFSEEDPEDATRRPGVSQGSIPRSTDEEKVTMKTFASVWDAIEDSQSEAASMKARAQLMRALQKMVTGWNLSQKASADRLGLTQPRLNDLLRGKIDKFSLDALFDLTGRVGLKVSIALRKAA